MKRFMKWTVALAIAALSAQTASADLIYGAPVYRGQDIFDNPVYYITFTSGTGNWSVPAGVSVVEVLVVGGGGGGASGGTWNADGGGAGGLAYYSS